MQLYQKMDETDIHFKYATDDKVDEDCYQFVAEAFVIDDALITNKSILEDFYEAEDIPGHSWVPFSQVPIDERQKYISENSPAPTDPDKYLVYYPPLTPEELQEVRDQLLNRLEITYGVSFAQFPPEEELYVWKIVSYLRARGIQFIREETDDKQ